MARPQHTGLLFTKTSFLLAYILFTAIQDIRGFQKGQASGRRLAEVFGMLCRLGLSVLLQSRRTKMLCARTHCARSSQAHELAVWTHSSCSGQSGKSQTSQHLIVFLLRGKGRGSSAPAAIWQLTERLPTSLVQLVCGCAGSLCECRLQSRH